MLETRKPRTLQISFIAGGIIMMVAVSGFFVGLRQTNSTISLSRPVEVMTSASRRDLTGAKNVPLAVRYIDQDWIAHGPNALWRTSLVDFTQLPPSPRNASRVISPEEKALALKDRASRRAYDGAPPVVPHPITQDSSASCLACHQNGLQVKDRFASKISHATFGGNCTQCHVSSQGTFPAADAVSLAVPLAENLFQGKSTPTTGTRAWKGAPPTVPHRTLMRSDCMSCHGTNGMFALRTPHPERQSCTQCHVSSAVNDQREFIQAPPLGGTVP